MSNGTGNFLILSVSGLFKVEWAGDGFIGLAAKTYFCYNKEDSTKDKFSAKGIMKSAGVTRQDYEHVLKLKTSIVKANKGFIMKDKKMLTYSMDRAGLSYFYCKRKVLEDGISTTFLDL